MEHLVELCVAVRFCSFFSCFLYRTYISGYLYRTLPVSLSYVGTISDSIGYFWGNFCFWNLCWNTSVSESDSSSPVSHHNAGNLCRIAKTRSVSGRCSIVTVQLLYCFTLSVGNCFWNFPFTECIHLTFWLMTLQSQLTHLDVYFIAFCHSVRLLHLIHGTSYFLAKAL